MSAIEWYPADPLLAGPGGWPPIEPAQERPDDARPCDTEPAEESEAERLWRITQEIARGG